MTTHASKPDDIVDLVRSSDAQKVKVAVSDIDGILRGKYIHKDKFLSAVKKGFGFCDVIFGWDSSDVCYDNVSYTGWHTGYPDAHARLDLSTFRQIPWEKQLPFFLGDFVTPEGGPLAICPRQVLKAQIKKAHDLGFFPFFAMEFEWFNFRETSQSLHAKEFRSLEPLTPGMFGYSIQRMASNRDFFTALMDELLAFHVPIEGLHTETGPGVYEAAIAVTDTLEAADRAVLFKTSAKEIAYRFGIMPTFMAKWNAKLPGCSGHVHQSLWDMKQETNLFYDPQHPHQMSELFEQYLAGQMHCLPFLLPMFAPTINSYKRLVEGMWAPTRVTWGVENRTTAFRVIPGGDKATRLETRVPGSDVNPYLALAAALASGLYGIENRLSLPTGPIKGSAYAAKDAIRLPSNLLQATEQMDRSEIPRKLFSSAFVDHFTKTRFWEWRRFQEEVTSWELARYFEII